MKFFTSYFYNVRHLKPNQIPISTACSDPKWYHEFKGNNHKFIDKNNVINGIRCEQLHPDQTCHNLCHGKENCQYNPHSCKFLEAYQRQLENIDMQRLLTNFKKLECSLELQFKLKDIEFILLVHEAPTNDCSERKALQKLFNCQELNVNATKS